LTVINHETSQSSGISNDWISAARTAAAAGITMPALARGRAGIDFWARVAMLTELAERF
jgi:ornithine cyclodeaminase/alanine dehydrogenase-like protein (mu-crystallin family)